ncbi:molecular chaperone DnaJ [Ammoniphilus sp. YIM 78166]|uniref:molecular chaperone DnaJ n=1 Tax=Ammoniphilus sp. YIM 78166 TaxID=1644106 RepID=UPI00106F305D|nr:molecular chaperone DnaJ [Ammoniphilus sp. YIM 78166]
MVIEDEFTRELVETLGQLTEGWKDKLRKRQIKLDFAYRIGQSLSKEEQQRMDVFLKEMTIHPKHESRVLTAFSLGISEWAIQDILRIYSLGETIQQKLKPYNDIMAEFRRIYVEGFEAEFLEGRLPKDEWELEDRLKYYQLRLQTLMDQVPKREQSYNRSYGDSSISSIPENKETRLIELIGLKEDATHEEILKQFRHLLKVLHPDTGGSAYLFGMVKREYERYQRRE